MLKIKLQCKKLFSEKFNFLQIIFLTKYLKKGRQFFIALFNNKSISDLLFFNWFIAFYLWHLKNCAIFWTRISCLLSLTGLAHFK